MQRLLVVNHVLLEEVRVHLGDLGIEALLDLVCQLLDQAGTVSIVLMDRTEGVIVVDVVGCILHPQVFQQHQESLLCQLRLIDVEVTLCVA